MAYYDTDYFQFKLNLIIIKLEFIVDRVMVPLNQVFPVQPHLHVWEGLYSVRCHASGRCLQRGKVMGVRYPGPVSRHNLVCPLLILLWYLVPIWDHLSFTTTVAVDAFGRHRATQDLAQWGVSRSGSESVMAMEGLRRNAVGPPEWECEAMDSVVWVQCATSAECVCVKSIDRRVLGHGHKFVVGHTIRSR